MNYDIIGDIHGHADQLRQLLEKMDYMKTENGYAPPSGRKANFVGEFIDRGPQIKQTLEIVKSMCDQGAALAVLGNHEYNALCFHTKQAGQSDSWLRPRNDKNINQHLETLYQFKDKDYLVDWKNYLNWFMTLPIFLDLSEIRTVHAAWISTEIDKIRKWTDCSPTEHPRLTPELLQKSANKGTQEYNAFETVLKGVEIKLPDGCPLEDKDEHPRGEARIRWWEPIANKSYGELIFPRVPLDCSDKMIDPGKTEGLFHYSDPVPVFFGHYWRDPEIHKLKVQSDHICCLDYSVAKGGRLVAYRWEGEKTLRSDHFEFVQ